MEGINKEQLALNIKNTNHSEDISCALLEEEILKECSGCVLKGICERIDGIVRELKNTNINVVSEVI